MKKCSTSLGIKETQIKTTMRDNLIPVRMAKTNNSGNSRCWWGCREKRTPHTLLVEMQNAATLEVPQKVKTRTSLWSSVHTIRYLFKGYKNSDSKGHMHPNVYSNITNNSQTMERPLNVLDWWMDKDVVYIDNGILCSHQKEENPAICNDMDGVKVYYAGGRSKMAEE